VEGGGIPRGPLQAPQEVQEVSALRPVPPRVTKDQEEEMNDSIELKRPECAGCSYWTTRTGKFLQYEQPDCGEREEINPKTGETTIVYEPPDISIHVPQVETRAWCEFPFGLCKLNAEGIQFVVCNGCPLFCNGKCDLGSGHDRMSDDVTGVLLEECTLLNIETTTLKFKPPKRTFGKE